MKIEKLSSEFIRDNAYDALERFWHDCAVVRNSEDIGEGHWIISKDEAKMIQGVLEVLRDCGAGYEF